MSQSNNYFTTKVQTASPPRLHLMLIEGALRFGRQAEEQLAAGDSAKAKHFMTRALDIVAELLSGVRHDESDINKKLADLYQFLFHTLTSAYVNDDAEKLTDVMRILEFERETWQLACEKVGENAGKGSTAAIANHLPSTAPTTGLSIEA